MLNDETKNYIDQKIREHEHDGVNARQIKDREIFGGIASRVLTDTQTIATTGNTDWYVIVPIGGYLESADFSGIDALATSDTNYITFTITNLGRDGSGSTIMLAATNANTTKVAGTAIAANTVRELTLAGTSSTTVANVVAGERLRIRAAATGTLANTVTGSVFLLRFK